MKENGLIFVPYQDTDNFFSDGILTREYAILYLLYTYGFKKVINVKKPRTWLDKKRYTINELYYPDGTIENKVKSILEDCQTIQYLPAFSLEQVVNRRGWWNNGYLKSYNDLRRAMGKDDRYLVYSDNPFAYKLIEKLKEQGCRIYFDIMDNFSIHPSLNESERRLALQGYQKVLKIADVVSANSQQTCDSMQQYSDKKIILVKNGVFLENEVKGIINISQIEEINKAKGEFKRTAGYIGKIGKRLDADLIDKVSENCKDTLFVFVGPYLKGQMNDKLIRIFDNRKNVIHIEGVPSAYVYAALNCFDILIIPHAVGKNENGGDPLKLYQYLTRNKPIITTPILGVDEFKEKICIAKTENEWIEFINSDHNSVASISNEIKWEERFRDIIELIK